MRKYRIVIIEKDEKISLHLNSVLQEYGYTVVGACDSAEQVHYKIGTVHPDILLIGISLEESSDGIELAKKLKEHHNIPFIYLAKDSNETIISQAKLTEPYGYLIKPIDSDLLYATIEIALFKFEQEKRRKENSTTIKVNRSNLEKMLYSKRSSEKPIVHFAKDYHLDINICETFYNDKKIKLTKKENAFLRLLVAQLGNVVSFEQAMNYVWDGSGATENSVRTLVWRLRNKLETDIIKNASGIGYYIEE